ncbi:hypothetical protein JG688_00012507 [Phytophthora aleatoria]|uniref:Uncharacterized protein n=1 Tax=Phytophthora aleatoria TaxID=2496075 RepID=A0A8J5IF57_9STRA|nr:hypothetical protein JG688_00012507 [Phytophthora aleatoria]
MTSLMAERLNGDHGTGVTAMDTNQRALYGATAEALNELTVVKQKPYIAQITVYGFRQVDGVGFYADIVKRRVQYGRGKTAKIFEVTGPPLKRKGIRATGQKKTIAKPQYPSTNVGSETDADEQGVVMKSEEKKDLKAR